MSHEQDQRFGRERFQVRIEREHGEHTIGDACPAVINPGLTGLAQDIYIGVAFTVRFYPIIRELNQLVKGLQVDAEPLAEFSEGAVFDPHAYPIGTMLRISAQRDTFTTEFVEENFDRYKNQENELTPPLQKEKYRDNGRSRVSYGIVARNGRLGQKCVVGSPGIFDEFDEILMDRVGTTKPHLLTVPYIVGTWRHQVTTRTREVDHQTVGQFDYFYRLNKIEVMIMGKGDREKKSEPIPLFHRVKNAMRTAN